MGGRLPLAQTGVGLVLLAFAPPAVQEEAIARYWPAHGDDVIRDDAGWSRGARLNYVGAPSAPGSTARTSPERPSPGTRSAPTGPSPENRTLHKDD
ncbi:hypothetical protein ABZ719_33350 [Streptomyces sp. NPDC006743]|uniref:hypothetical protein n=1 Tax=Streptomyces sp. NPDC006743 TaxID=3154480 RepID=UPI003454A409